MKSIKQLGKTPAGISVLSDDLIEFHASRIILLIFICGVKARKDKLYKIEGLTKLAKLDFFLRYPDFFRIAAKHLQKEVSQSFSNRVESKMVRFHYGPWDERYYQILPFLEARGLLQVIKDKATYNFCLTSLGIEVAEKLVAQVQFSSITNDLREIKSVLSGMNGTALKNLVYKLFEHEVVDKKLKETISYG
jgi:hypothetical protein